MVARAVESVVLSAAFATDWAELLRIAQPVLTHVLEGSSEPAGGVLISIDFGGPLANLQSALDAEGLSVRSFDHLAPEQKKVTILASDRLVQVHQATNILHEAYAILPIVVLGIFSLDIANTILALVLFGGGSIGLNRTANDNQRGAAISVFDALTERLRTTIGAMFAAGLFLNGIARWLKPTRSKSHGQCRATDLHHILAVSEGEQPVRLGKFITAGVERCH